MYFPENDLALAAGIAGYTAPPTARRLHAAGEALPLWTAGRGDRFVCSGVNARWLNEMRDAFGIEDVDVYDHRDCTLTAAPWGWSPAARRALEAAGYPTEKLPDDHTLARLRMLSHRRTASALAREMHRLLPFTVAEPAAEANDTDCVRAYMSSHPAVIAKAPWSCSGRGLVRSRLMPDENFMQQAAGIIRRQGSVMLEPELDKAIDFAMLFEADGRGDIALRGISVFDTNARGGYTSNALAPQPTLLERVEAAAGTGRIRAVEKAMRQALPAILGDYRGPLGVDMLVTRDGMLDVSVELNLRYTMGFVAMDFARYLAPGAEGTLTVVPNPGQPIRFPLISGGRMYSGTLDLSPGNHDFAIRAVVNS